MRAGRYSPPVPRPALPPARLREVYDRVGASQDRQAWYEDAATDVLLRWGAFEDARAVVEMGCGTGRLAARLLERSGATYRGTDLSPVMVALARERLAPFGDRATIALVAGGPPAAPPGSADRFLAAYVLDTLSEADAAATLDAAHGLLAPGGRLCVASLGGAVGPLSRAVGAAWRAVYRVRPALVGGCRPVRVLPLLDPARWRVLHAEAVAPWGVPSEAVVAERRGETAGGV